VKIFKCYWFNEDYYGPTEGIYAIVQAENEIAANKLSIETIKKRFEKSGSFNFDQYEKYECTDITNEKVLNTYYHGVFG